MIGLLKRGTVRGTVACIVNPSLSIIFSVLIINNKAK